MHPGVLRALEFDRIVEAVRSFALTPMGDARLALLAPAIEPPRVAELLVGTSETVRYLASNALFPLRASSELPDVLAALAVEGRPLEPLRLLALADFLDSVEEARGGIRRAAGSFPLLESITGAVASFKRETSLVREKIEPSGEVADNASPELKSIRERQRKQRARLRGTLESFMRGKDTVKYLQDQVVTERNGRYVLVVKAEHRSSIPGIVHGASTSGASLFLEPLSTVEINNDIVALRSRSARFRHPAGLTDAFRGEALISIGRRGRGTGRAGGGHGFRWVTVEPPSHGRRSSASRAASAADVPGDGGSMTGRLADRDRPRGSVPCRSPSGSCRRRPACS